jgi:very-short-patch-repair endonuclease
MDRKRWRAKNPSLQVAARQLRRRQTPAEDALWEALRRDGLDGLHFRRQHIIDRFVLDFYCAAHKLCIEVDGGVHDQQADYDEHRTAALALHGIRVVRFRNEEILDDLPRALDRLRREIYLPALDPEE